MKTLHIDMGREMQGGQWQVIYLLERLEDARLRTPPGSALRIEALRRGIEIEKQFRAPWDNPALIHAHDAKAHRVAAMVNFRSPRKPLIVSRRVGFPIRKSILSRWKYQQASLYIAISRYVAAQLEDAGIHSGLIRIVFDGVPVPATPSTLEPGRVIALASKSVTIPGIRIQPVSDLWRDLSTASVFVYRSEMEGLGSALLAAMASGVPVVASRVGGVPEIVAHGETGLLVENGRFDDPVRYLLDNPEKAAEMGRRGRQLVQSKFTADHMAEETRRVYQEVIG